MSNKQKFLEFHNDDPHVYELFKRFSLEAIKIRMQSHHEK